MKNKVKQADNIPNLEEAIASLPKKQLEYVEQQIKHTETIKELQEKNDALLNALKAVEKDYSKSSTGAIRTETIDIVLETIKNAEK